MTGGFHFLCNLFLCFNAFDPIGFLSGWPSSSPLSHFLSHSLFLSLSPELGIARSAPPVWAFCPDSHQSSRQRVVYVITILGMTACLVLNDLYRSTLRNTCNCSTYDYQTQWMQAEYAAWTSQCIDKNKKARIYTVGRERVFVCVRDSAGCMNGWAL